MPTMDYNVLIHKKLSGQITDEEQRKLDNWIASDPVNQHEFDEIKLIWESAEEDDDEVTDEHFKEEFVKLENAVQDSVRKERQLHRYKVKGRLKSAAIAVLLIAGVYFLATEYYKPEVTHPVYLSSNQHNEVILSDSSRVILNDSSSLSFEEFSGRREANLKGEAFFHVTKDHRPFVVHTQDARVSVLGTSFIVKAYPAQPVEVYVITGKVEVDFHGKQIMLTSSEKSITGGDQNLFYEGINDDPNFNSWYTRKLEFNKTELRRILELIEKLYRITFTVKEEEVLGCRFTGTFDNAKLENVLKTLSFSMDIEFESRIGNYYEVSGKGCVP